MTTLPTPATIEDEMSFAEHLEMFRCELVADLSNDDVAFSTRKAAKPYASPHRPPHCPTFVFPFSGTRNRFAGIPEAASNGLIKGGKSVCIFIQPVLYTRRCESSEIDIY